MKQILQRFSQESTWRGIFAVGASLCIVIEPALQEAIVAAAFGLIGIINILKKD